MINKKILVGIVAVIAIGWFVLSSSDKSVVTDDMENTVPTTQIATSTKPVAKATTTVKKTSVPLASQPVSLSYQSALELYKDNKRIQLSGADFCQVSPNNVMYKNGTSIMIDNRSAQIRTIKIGGTSYSIEGYGFKIVKLSSATLPATLLMDCNQQQNVAKILLQK